jgi:hypothetical protein
MREKVETQGCGPKRGASGSLFPSRLRDRCADSLLYFSIEERVIEVVRFRRGRVVNDDGILSGLAPNDGGPSFSKKRMRLSHLLCAPL